ncbi:hypothetical protein GCM10012285_61470 [Streptomyces kronopolitis]|uniref:Uncharacterized protein n=2 Tax=Streptomyces kronopolitis TaxID=1612435 RepID=A0ABQ2K2D0_9ACTN|nr:hypothetical protein GCM10012285_61470 [Streptomyces kronopolitis]
MIRTRGDTRAKIAGPVGEQYDRFESGPGHCGTTCRSEPGKPPAPRRQPPGATGGCQYQDLNRRTLMPNSIARRFPAVTGGLVDTIDDIEKKDEGRGYEAEDAVRRLDAWKARRAQTAGAEQRLNALLLRLVAEGDARIAARAAENTLRAGCAA